MRKKANLQAVDLEDSAASSGPAPVTPDGRYFVVRERLWRCSNPALSPDVREQLVHALMAARRAKGAAMRARDRDAREQARRAVDQAKHQLGERGEVWWTDGAPDENRHMVRNTAYAGWYAQLTETATRTATTIPSRTVPRAKPNAAPPPALTSNKRQST